MTCENEVEKSTIYHMRMICSSHKKSMRMMMAFLRGYEDVYGEMIYLTKSYMYMHDKVLIIICQRIRRIAGIAQGTFPFTYLGCPMYYWKKENSIF